MNTVRFSIMAIKTSNQIRVIPGGTMSQRAESVKSIPPPTRREFVALGPPASRLAPCGRRHGLRRPARVRICPCGHISNRLWHLSRSARTKRVRILPLPCYWAKAKNAGGSGVEPLESGGVKWIPAFAGMTMQGTLRHIPTTTRPTAPRQNTGRRARLCRLRLSPCRCCPGRRP